MIGLRLNVRKPIEFKLSHTYRQSSLFFLYLYAHIKYVSFVDYCTMRLDVVAI